MCGLGQHGTRVVMLRGRPACHTLCNAEMPGQRGLPDVQGCSGVSEAPSLHLAI